MTKLPQPYSWPRAEARTGKFDGKFLIGVRTTGIYCLPSCPTHPAKPENVTLVRGEAEALGLRLRACKRCRPDLYYKGRSEDAELFAGLAARVRADLEAFPGATALARAAGIGLSKLARLVREQAGLPPAAWLRQERLAAAERLLRESDLKVSEIALRAGFAAPSAFHRLFAARHGIPPGAWRKQNSPASPSAQSAQRGRWP